MFKRISVLDVVAIISAIGIIGWIVTDFYGGMFIWALSYPLLVFITLILYLISFVDLLFSFYKKEKNNKIRITAHLTVVLAIISLNIFSSEIFKSKQILSATLKDDLFYYTLVFRENGKVENQINGFLGYSDTFYGKYEIKDSLIIFSKVPYDREGFIPDTLLIDKNQKAIFINKDQKGNFSTKKEWLNHFEIVE